VNGLRATKNAGVGLTVRAIPKISTELLARVNLSIVKQESLAVTRDSNACIKALRPRKEI